MLMLTCHVDKSDSLQMGHGDGDPVEKLGENVDNLAVL